MISALLTLITCAVGFSLLSGAAQRRERLVLWLAFAAHIAAASAQVWLTQGVYGEGDMLSYWRVGSQLALLLEDDPSGTLPEILRLIGQDETFRLPVQLHGAGRSTGSMYGIAALLVFLTRGSLIAACLLIATTALAGKVLLFRALSTDLPAHRRIPALIMTIGMPSLVFWSSGLLKESLVMGPMGLAVWSLTRVGSGRRFWTLLGLGPVTFAIAILKAYLLFPLAIAAAAAWYARRAIDRNGRLQIRPAPLLLMVVLTLGVIVGLGVLFPRYSIDNLQEETNRLQGIGATLEGGSNYRLTEPSEEGGLRALLLAPLALLTSLFRPLPFEANNALSLLASLETSVALILVLRIAVRVRWNHLSSRILSSPILIYCVVFTLVAGVAIGLSTTNFGTLSRYRIPLTPFFGFLLVVLQPDASTRRLRTGQEAGARPRRRYAPALARPPEVTGAQRQQR